MESNTDIRLRPDRQMLGAAVLVGVMTLTASAQWKVINLHPAGATESRAEGVHDGQQVGYAVVGGARLASLWSGTAASWVNLGSAAAFESLATGVYGGRQVGYAAVGGVGRASLWSGDADSWVDLHPAGATSSFAMGAGECCQAGWARIVGVEHACLWTGSAASWVDLHPTGATLSIAYGVDGGQQAGWTVEGTSSRASLWRGTAASWVDLNPIGATDSQALRVGGGQQVGWAHVDGVSRASLWSGTAASWVDLHPAGAVQSDAWGVNGLHQVGSAWLGDTWHAILWTGSSNSWQDLNSHLPAAFRGARAQDIWQSDGFTYIVGYGFDTATGSERALMWVKTLCDSVVQQQPVDQSVGAGVPVTFIVQASQPSECSGPLVYQWQRRNWAEPDETVPEAWRDMIEGGGFLNTDRPALTILNPTPGLAGPFRCRISGSCGCDRPIYSNAADFTVACPADFNGDGGVDGADIEAFFARWEDGC